MACQTILEQLENDFGDWFDGKFPIPTMTKNNYPYTSLFKPIQINRLQVKNRVVMAPMGNICMADETGRPSEQMIAYFEARAKGGVGLITTGLIPTSFGVDPSLQEPGALSIFPRIDRSRTVLSGWRDLSAACHAHGSKVFIQLTPGMGRVGNPQCMVTQKKMPVSASWNPNFYMDMVPCRPLTDAQIKKIIKQTGQAAADAKAANLDGVYLHGHEGYLMEQLTNSAFNRRKLGKFADCERFGIETVKEIRKRCGETYPIMYRIDLSLALNATYGKRMDEVKSLKKFKDERTIEETLTYMKHLVEAGVDIFDVDLGCYDNWWLPHPPASMPSGCFLSVSELVKKYFEENKIVSNQGISVPVVAVGKLGYPDLAEQALRDDQCDMVMLGRPLLADPDFVQKAYRGEVEDIIPCIGCQEGCVNEFIEGGHPQCAVNPETGFERDRLADIMPAAQKKSFAVVGAGPAGVEAALTLLKRGHQVTLYEKGQEIGGALVPGSQAKIKYELKNYQMYLQKQIEKAQETGRLELRLSANVAAEDLAREEFDGVVVATGAKQASPPIVGMDLPHVFNALEVLKNPDLVKDGKKIVVIGGGVVGFETGYMLRYEEGKTVDIVEMSPYMMNHTCTANRGHLIHYAEKAGIKLHNATAVKKIEKNQVLVDKNISKTVPDPYETWKPILPENVEVPFHKPMEVKWQAMELQADYVVVAAGVRSENQLYADCVENRVAKEVHVVGDSLKPGRVFEAVRAARRKAMSL